MKKSFKDTKVGNFLSKVAPSVLDIVGDSIPGGKMIKSLLQNSNIELSVPQEAELNEAIRQYELEEYQMLLDDRAGARAMYISKSVKADQIAESIMKWNLPMILGLVVLNILATLYLDKALLAIVANVIGFVLNALITERSTLIQFFFGSSEGSKTKDNKLNLSK